ncbi:hypothetical protein TDB9533_00785 [Thalassocella blandensis]|nr:hypothetical protein TDB9533_00785 [Thalassocella blandensis]
MANGKPLFLHEEVMLLALRDEEGTLAIGYTEQVIAGAVVAQLLLDSRISVDDSRKRLVSVEDKSPTGDPILDECLEKIAASKRQGSLQNWVASLAITHKLSLKVIQQLCERKILRADQDKVLFIFKRKIFPEINPEPEKLIVERLRAAIFTEQEDLDPRTIILVSLANWSGILRQTFGSKEVKARQPRIEKITNGELTGKATMDVITACQAAAMIAAVVPAVAATVCS